MPTTARLPLKDIATGIDGVRLTNVAWIRQAEQHNKASQNLPGARERTPILAGALFWLEKLGALAEAAGGDDARVEAFIDRAIVQARQADVA